MGMGVDVGACCTPALAQEGSGCPAGLVGVWTQDMAACESLSPFLTGLGVPSFVHPIVDALHTALHITSSDDDPGGDGPGQVCIVDFTLFGANTTSVPLDGSEARKATRGGRKQFMLSGCVTPAAAGEEEPPVLVITCRLFQRGEGWATRMERSLLPDGRLLELNVLTRPDEEDVVVRRYFRRGTDAELPSGAGGWLRRLIGTTPVTPEPQLNHAAPSAAAGEAAAVAKDGGVRVAEIEAQRAGLLAVSAAVAAGCGTACLRGCASRG